MQKKFKPKNCQKNFQVSSLISGCAIFGFGCGLSIYSGIVGLLHPATLESLSLVRAILWFSGIVITHNCVFI